MLRTTAAGEDDDMKKRLLRIASALFV